jgi:glycerophosphoryl diester phosphodiesterase
VPALDWLTGRPVAHRGLHDAAHGIVENTPSAVSAAVAGGYGIEVDLQITADGEAMVHHDDALGRLTDGSGDLASMSAAALKQVPFKSTADRMITLGELCDMVAGRVTLVLELKSRFNNDLRLVARTAAVLKNYAGPAAVMSFDPAQVAAMRTTAPTLTRGIVAERWYTHHEWQRLSSSEKRNLAFLLHGLHTRPHFVAYGIRDLPALAPLVARNLFGRPLLTWTVRTLEDRMCAQRWADQMIFEGFRA